MHNVYVVGSDWSVEVMFQNSGYKLVDTLEKAELVVFTGGEDVSPNLYGEEPHPSTFFNPERDKHEVEVFEYCVTNQLPMVGICRGGQFLNVMNGGKLWQHVKGHGIRHFHGARRIDVDDNVLYMVTSTHHQMMRPATHGKVLVEADFIDLVTTVGDQNHQRGIEAVFYEDTQCLCFQPHPEFTNNGATRVLFFDLIEEYLGLVG